MNTKKQIYKINQGFITHKIGNKTAIFQGEKSLLFKLNDSGAFIFNGLKLGWKMDKIIKDLSIKFSIDEKTAMTDVSEFTEVLLKKKIIIPVDKS